jgi:hypothetical protein
MDIATCTPTATISTSSDRFYLRMPRASLERVLQELGIVPVSAVALSRHRRAMLKANPAHWVHRQVDALFGSAVFLGVAGTMAGLFTQYYWLLLSMLIPVAFIGVVSSIRLRGPSQWVEKPVTLPQIDKDAPAEIAALARRLKAEMPTVIFRMGELIQDRVVLDPYLIVSDGDTEACVGIWLDGSTVAVAMQGAK